MFDPIDDISPKNPAIPISIPALFKIASYQGKTYFVPIGWNNIMINYNRDSSREQGLAIRRTGPGTSFARPPRG